MSEQPGSAESNPEESKGLSFWQVLSSTAAAAFGVQSQKNRERDFNRGKAKHFIFIGILITVVWYVGIYLVVKWVLKST